ncbi:MAG: GNAT family N-acetyltransferase [Alphaproteobacteria bacterium]|nr:GNAT family N-acetyltransferase [Alphaproteobacteria bacterium]
MSAPESSPDGPKTDPSTKPPAVTAEAPAIRPAAQADVGLILDFVRELAAYERLSHEVVADDARIFESLFGAAPKAQCLIAELDGAPVGFALYFHNYSTFLGRYGVYLEDLFVRPPARGRGAGKALLAKLAEITLAGGGGRLEWSVLNWNAPSIAFYRSLGAEPMDEWTVHRLTGPALRRLARTSRGFRVTMVVAAARNGVIGRDGGLPWRLSADLKRFKATTMSKPVVMGRKTYESIGKALPGRPNIVVSRRSGFAADGVIAAPDPEAALALAESEAARVGAGEICIIGGGEVYRALIDDVDEVRLTIVDAHVEGDASMPSLPFSGWRGEIVGAIAPDARNDARAWFVDLRRV